MEGREVEEEGLIGLGCSYSPLLMCRAIAVLIKSFMADPEAPIVCLRRSE